MLNSLLDHPQTDYAIGNLSHVLTPALAIYPEKVAHNIETTIALVGHDPARWRPHLKTVKLPYVMRMLADRGIQAVKCATTLELLTACEAGFQDVLLAYPVTGANSGRVAEIAAAFPKIAISVLVDSEDHVNQWEGSPVSLFLDVDPGMKRTGIPQEDTQKIAQLVQRVMKSGIGFRGLHYYDGHLRDEDLQTRSRKAHAGYDSLLKITSVLEGQGVPLGEVITSGTPTFPCALSYSGFAGASFIHRVSPGTIVYCDTDTQACLPLSYGYQIAATVLTRVVSSPVPGRVACDAGHKAVSVDPGVPNCEVLGWQGLIPSRPSEEHLPITVHQGAQAPELGEILYLAPRHVCPTVNNFSHALIVRQAEIVSVEPVSARGREAPLWHPVGVIS